MGQDTLKPTSRPSTLARREASHQCLTKKITLTRISSELLQAWTFRASRMALEVIAADSNQCRDSGASNRQECLQGNNKKTIWTMRKEKRLLWLNNRMKRERGSYTSKNVKRKKWRRRRRLGQSKSSTNGISKDRKKLSRDRRIMWSRRRSTMTRYSYREMGQILGRELLQTVTWILVPMWAVLTWPEWDKPWLREKETWQRQAEIKAYYE